MMAGSGPSCVAVDWGTSSFRLWVLDAEGQVLADANGPFGMGTLTPTDYEPFLERQLCTLNVPAETPVLICGMAGAAGGWVEAAYLPHDGDLRALADHATIVPTQTRNIRILPGLKQSDPANVMRGEETQLLGLLSQDSGFHGTAILPGTHTKWVRLNGGRIKDFTTCLTGELYHLLAQQSVLRHSMSQDGWDDRAFHVAVTQALHRPESVATRLFGLRADMLLADLSPGVARSRLSGWLIGLELAATRAYWQTGRVVLIGAPDLCRCYCAALRLEDVHAETIDAQKMTLEGLTLARSWIKDHDNEAQHNRELAGDHTKRGRENRAGSGRMRHNDV